MAGFYWLLLLHLICCLVMGICMCLGLLKVRKILLIPAFCIPLFGELGILAIWASLRSGRSGTKMIGLDKHDVQEAIYKSITIENGHEERNVVPLEEALLINDSQVKRSLIMGILMQNPEEYVDVLNQARMDADTEVVHYAITAMTEISKTYDLELQSLEAEYTANQEDEKVLNRYLDKLDQYIGKGIGQGQFLVMQRYQYAQLIRKKLEQDICPKWYGKLAENSLELKEYGEAIRIISEMETYWPEAETMWLLKLRCFVEQKQGQRVQEIIKEIKEKQIFLSADGKEIIRFLQKGTEETNGSVQ